MTSSNLGHFASAHELARSHTEAIAIVGMGCRFPGGATDPESYWKLLEEGRDAVGDVPKERWDVQSWYDPDSETPGKTVVRQGGFVEDLDRFDAGYFGIMENEARFMDPQQRMLLEETVHALEDAPFPPRRSAGRMPAFSSESIEWIRRW